MIRPRPKREPESKGRGGGEKGHQYKKKRARIKPTLSAKESQVTQNQVLVHLNGVQAQTGGEQGETLEVPNKQSEDGDVKRPGCRFSGQTRKPDSKNNTNG